jgi:hypothetical protein
MGYQRFKLEQIGLSVATVATVATVAPLTAPSVANVASVAGHQASTNAPSDLTVASIASPEASEDEDWQAHFEERAAIREFDGGFTRPAAEAHALQDTIAVLGPARGARHGKLH